MRSLGLHVYPNEQEAPRGYDEQGHGPWQNPGTTVQRLQKAGPCKLSRVLVGSAIFFAAGAHARADLTPPSGTALTGGLISGVVLHQDAGNSTFVDAELALTYYPGNFAGGALTPGLVVDAGGEFAPNRGRLTVFRDGGDDTEFGVGLKMILWGNSSKLEGALNR